MPIREDRFMARYFYAWTPLVVVGTVALLSLPWLALIALTIVFFAALAALAGTIVYVPYRLSLAIGRRWKLRPVAMADPTHGLDSAYAARRPIDHTRPAPGQDIRIAA
jgi:hypothetical protein